MKKLIIGTVLLIVSYFIYNNSIQPEDEESLASYIEEIEKERTSKDEFMTTSVNSPFAIYKDTTITLNYFPIDTKYKVTARIELIEENLLLTLGASDGDSQKYRKYAYANFKINDTPLKLLVLKNTNTGDLFTAFADQTSANQSYGAGRYLDLNFKRAKTTIIDFNLAYNPYCNYNSNFSCPFPPVENLLDIAILAGEKKYGKN